MTSALPAAQSSCILGKRQAWLSNALCFPGLFRCSVPPFPGCSSPLLPVLWPRHSVCSCQWPKEDGKSVSDNSSSIKKIVWEVSASSAQPHASLHHLWLCLPPALASELVPQASPEETLQHAAETELVRPDVFTVLNYSPALPEEEKKLKNK